MSQPTLNSSFSGINFAGMNRGSRLSYTSLRAASGDNSINEEERLSTPNVHDLGGSSRGSLTIDHGSPRLSQPDVRRFSLQKDVAGKRERLSQPTLVTGDYHPGRGQHRLSQPCLSMGKDMQLPTMVFHSPSPPPIKHKRFSPAIHASQRDRLSQLDIGAKYRNLKEASGVKFNRDRFSIPELETQNDLRLIAGTPKQRFSLDSQLTRTTDPGRSRLLPIASSPITEQQQPKIEDLAPPPIIPSSKLKSPTREGLGNVLVASTTPILPPGERQFLSPELALGKKMSLPCTSLLKGQTNTQNKFPSIPPIPTRERMSVPEIRNSSLRRLLDPPSRQRHSITGNLRHSIVSPLKPLDFGNKKSAKYAFEEALERFRKMEKEENRKNEIANEMAYETTNTTNVDQEPKHIQRHYSYTYETGDDSSSILGRLSVSTVPKKKYLESNFDKNEQVITTVIETDVPMILPSPKYAKKTTAYSSETPKWIRKYLESESPKVGRKYTGTAKERTGRKTTRRKSSLESIECEKAANKVRSRSVSSGDRSPKNAALQPPDIKNIKNTYVRMVPTNNAQEAKYEVAIETTWTDGGVHHMYDECDDTDSDDSTSI